MAQNVRTIQPGEYLCLQGEDSNEIYVLRAGELEIYVVDGEGIIPQDRVEGEGMLVGTVNEKGTFIGEIGAILNEPRTASMKVSAAGPVQVMVIPLRGKGFAATVVGNPKIGLGLSKTIAQRINATSDSITQSDTMLMRVKAAMEHYAKSMYEIVASIQEEALKDGKEIPLIAEAKSMQSCQVGRYVDKYGSVPNDIYAALGFPFSMHTQEFKNRSSMVDKAVAGTEAVPPAGPPKQGVSAFEPGSVVCPEKSVDQNMYILLAGRLEMYVGARSIELIKMKGDIFGENAMFGGMERSTGIRALTDVHAMPVPMKAIEGFLMKKPPVMVHVLKSFARRLPLLNETLLNTIQQMNQVMNLFGRGADSCIMALETLAPRIEDEAGGLGGKAASAPQAAKDLLEEIKGEFDEVNAEFEELCARIGYKPVEMQKESTGIGKLAPAKFEFMTKIEQIEMLEVEHVNFVFNPKKDQFRACASDFDHESLVKIAKVPDASKNDLIWGRIHNIGESFPIQFITIDLDNGGTADHDRDYGMRAVKYIVENSENEAAALFKGGRCIELMYIPDHIKIEGEELVDEATINEIFDAFKKKPDDRENLEKLNGIFWDLMIGTVQKKLPKVKDNIIPFDEEDLKLINFGLMDEQFLPDNSNVLQQMADDKNFVANEEQGLEYIYLSDSLQELYKEAFGWNRYQEMLGEKEQVEGKLKNCQDRIVAIMKGRMELLGTFPNGNAAKAVVQKIDGIVKSTAAIERKMKTGGSITNEERGKIVQIKNAKTALNNQVNKFLTTIKGKVTDDQISQFTDLGAELEKKVLEDLSIQEEVAKKHAEIQAHEKDMKMTTMKTKETAYKNEIIRIKKYMLLTAKKCKVDPMAVLVNVRDIATKTRVAEILDLFLQENVDPEIFDMSQQRLKQLGIPRIMLVPGTGVAVYDWEKHMFLVPLVYPKSLEESLANAFVEFHWDMDEDKSLRESYGALKIYKKLSIMKMKQQLAKDYVIWATQESKGWKKLDKEVRAWFLVKIAKQKVENK